MGKLYGMYCEQFPVNFPTSTGKLYGTHCEQFPANFPTSMGKLYVSEQNLSSQKRSDYMSLRIFSQSKTSHYSYQLLLACCGKGSKEAKGKGRRGEERRGEARRGEEREGEEERREQESREVRREERREE